MKSPPTFSHFNGMYRACTYVHMSVHMYNIGMCSVASVRLVMVCMCIVSTRSVVVGTYGVTLLVDREFLCNVLSL